ncbi:MAG: GPW/gp25 family protein [Armatimonadota bacterium]
MAIHSGKIVSIPADAGTVTPNFRMPGPHIAGLLYSFGDVSGEEFGLLADSEISVASLHTSQSDVRIGVTNPAAVDADVLVAVTNVVLTDLDMLLVTTQSLAMSIDLKIVISAAVDPNNGGYASNGASNPALDFLGKGLKFPFTFQKRSGGAQISTATSSDHAHIHESIRQILGTKKGERFMRPDFGTRLHELVFEPNDQLLYGLIRHEVMEALDAWEPRIIATDVTVGADDADEHLVLVNIRYRLISSQVEGNLVVPFWRELE